MAIKSHRIGYGVFLLLGAFALYCLLTALAGSDMAFAHCNGEFSLGASDPKCRNPTRWAIAFNVLLALAIVAMTLSLVLRKKHYAAEGKDT